MNRLRRFWQTITGQRARRWERACAIHESHRWDELERHAAAEERRTRPKPPRYRITPAYIRAKSNRERVNMERLLFGSRWIGPRPSAP